MAKIIINDSIDVKGNVSFNREKVVVPADKELNTQERIVLECNGVLATHLYIDEIHTIETERCIAHGVDVFRESIGSDDYNMIYHFTCDELEMKGVEIPIDEDSNAYYIITPDEMEMIENEMYKNDHPYLGGIGEEYKDFVQKEDKE